MSEPTTELKTASSSLGVDMGERTAQASDGIYGRYLAAIAEAERSEIELRDLFRATRLAAVDFNGKLIRLPVGPDSTVNRRSVGSKMMVRDVNDVIIDVRIAAIEEYNERRSGVLIDQNGKEVEVSHTIRGERSIAADPSQQALIGKDLGVYDSWTHIKDPSNPALEVRLSHDGRAIYVVEGESNENAVYAHWGINGFGQFDIEVEASGAPVTVSRGNVFDIVKRTIDFANTAELKPVESSAQIPPSTPESISLPAYPGSAPTPVTAPTGS